MRNQYRKPTSRSVLLAAILCGCWLTACTGVKSGLLDSSRSMALFSEQDHELIAENFVSILTQIDGMSPIPTTIQMMQPSTAFGHAIERAVIAAGYGHQLVDGDMGRLFLSYRIQDAQIQLGYSRAFQVTVGGVTLERDFSNINQHLTPASRMRVSGANIEGLVLGDDIFRFNNPNIFDSNLAAAVTDSNELPTATDQLNPKKDMLVKQTLLSQPKIPTEASVVVKPESSATQTSAKLPTQPATSKELANVIKLGVSNFHSLFKHYMDINKQHLLFAFDSYTMSTRSYERVAAALSLYDANSDIISVLGCSVGSTRLSLGNAGLAVKRTEVVKRALIRVGVEPVKIYDEHCWGDELKAGPWPRRGVLLTVKRRV